MRTKTTLRAVFRTHVANVIDAFYTASGLVVSLTNTGARRTFAEQARLNRPQSYAGPGESNHNYGNAVDIGFDGTIWFRRDRTEVTDNHWLGTLEGYGFAVATAFWDARDAVELNAPHNLFRLRFERIHLQSNNERNTSSGRSLAAHLTTVGHWNWRTDGYNRSARDWYYACDLGGSVFVRVGTADKIWAGTSSVSAALILASGWSRPVAAPTRGARGAAIAAPAVQLPATPPIRAADIAAVRSALQADFRAADIQWARWIPVP